MRKPPDPTNPDRPTTEPDATTSRFALRDDGALLLSLEDADDRDTAGREVISFIVLNDEESTRVRAAAEGAFAAVAANTIARMPKRDVLR